MFFCSGYDASPMDSTANPFQCSHFLPHLPHLNLPSPASVEGPLKKSFPTLPPLALHTW